MLRNAKFATKKDNKKGVKSKKYPSVSSEAGVIIFDAWKPSWSQGRKDLTTPKLTKATKKKILKI